jgi:hypothetical protein
MPTVDVEYDSGVNELVLHHLADNLPSIVAPQMNISDRQLHNGGVGLREIIVKFYEQSKLNRNANAIQITVYGHWFEERVARHRDMKDAITAGVQHALDCMRCADTAAVEVCLGPVEYGTINKEDS